VKVRPSLIADLAWSYTKATDVASTLIMAGMGLPCFGSVPVANSTRFNIPSKSKSLPSAPSPAFAMLPKCCNRQASRLVIPVPVRATLNERCAGSLLATCRAALHGPTTVGVNVIVRLVLTPGASEAAGNAVIAN